MESLTDFMFDVAGALGGGLPQDYFTSKELDQLESLYNQKKDLLSLYSSEHEKVFNIDKKIQNLIFSKK